MLHVIRRCGRQRYAVPGRAAPNADPEKAARKLVELANAFDPVQGERPCRPNKKPRTLWRRGLK